MQKIIILKLYGASEINTFSKYKPMKELRPYGYQIDECKQTKKTQI